MREPLSRKASRRFGSHLAITRSSSRVSFDCLAILALKREDIPEIGKGAGHHRAIFGDADGAQNVERSAVEFLCFRITSLFKQDRRQPRDVFRCAGMILALAAERCQQRLARIGFGLGQAALSRFHAGDGQASAIDAGQNLLARWRKWEPLQIDDRGAAERLRPPVCGLGLAIWPRASKMSARARTRTERVQSPRRTTTPSSPRSPTCWARGRRSPKGGTPRAGCGTSTNSGASATGPPPISTTSAAGRVASKTDQSRHHNSARYARY